MVAKEKSGKRGTESKCISSKIFANVAPSSAVEIWSKMFRSHKTEQDWSRTMLKRTWITWGEEDPPYIWATPSGGSAHKWTWKKEALGFACLTSCWQVHLSCCWGIPSLVLEPTSSGIPTYNEDQLRHPIIRFLDFTSGDSHCWTRWP